MDVKTLYTLLAVVDHRGFGEAGKAVGLSPSGVSLQIKGIEESFGLSLFDRGTRPPRLTRDGEAFVRRAREVVAGWERLTESLLADSAAGVLELGAIPTLVSGTLPIALGRLRLTSPDLRIRLTTGLSHELEALLHRGELDAALTTQPAEVGPGLTWTPFCSEPLAVIAKKGAKGKTDREILTGGPFIRFKRYAWAGRLIDEELRRRGIEVVSPMEVDSLEGIFSLVANGLGVSVVPRRNLARPFPPEVRAVPFGDPPVTRSLGVLQAVDNPRAHLVKQLYEELRAVSRPLAEASRAAEPTPAR
jgi:DNA-binding transcriptional LysR family regulator